MKRVPIITNLNDLSIKHLTKLILYEDDVKLLKELQNYKNRRKPNQHFKTAVFHIKFTLRHIKPNIYI